MPKQPDEMLAYDIEKLVRRASQTMEDTLDLWWYFTAFGVMYAFLSGAKSCEYAIPSGFDGVAPKEAQRVAARVVALGLELARGAESVEACLAVFEDRRNYYDSLEPLRKVPAAGSEALFAQGVALFSRGIGATSADGKVGVKVEA